MKAATSNVPRGWRIAAARLGIEVEAYAKEREAGRKWCYACSTFVPTSCFRGNSTKPDGLRSECSHCHQLQKAAQRECRQGLNSQGLTTIIRIPKTAIQKRK